MKYFIPAILVFSAIAFADEIRVRKMVKDGGLERSFVLQTNLSDKVVLDCQSFIQGLRIGEYETAHVFMMDPDGCVELQDRIRTSIRRLKQHCIVVEDDIKSDETCR